MWLQMDWLHRVDPTSGNLTLADLGDDPSIYLLPERDFEPDLEECLKEVCEEIFAEQLNGWYRAEELWPGDRGFGIFQLWFDWRFHSVLVDVAKEPLIVEDL